MRRCVLLVIALQLAACAGRGPLLPLPDAAGATAPAVELSDTPFFAQQDYQCGPAALATVLTANGGQVTPEVLRAQVYLPQRQGSLQPEIIAATRRHGQVPYLINPRLADLLAELAAGHPVLVLQNLGVSWLPAWHYAVVIGYDRRSDTVVLRSGTTRRKVMPAAEFMRSWSLGEYWGLVALPPDRLPASPDAARYLRAVAGLEAVGQLDAAAQAYRTALTRWPDAGLAWLGRGNVAYRQGRLADAEHAYRQASVLSPAAAAALNNLAQVEAERGCAAQGLRTLQRLPADAALPPGLRGTVAATRRGILAMDSDRPAAHCQDAAR